MASPQRLHFDLAGWLAQAERDLADFEARLRQRTPRFLAEDRVSLFGDLYRVRGCAASPGVGYELDLLGSGLGPSPLFLPLDLEPLLLPVDPFPPPSEPEG